MRISAEEKMMYTVMKAMYESSVPISFKGSMVLKACLMEAGYTEDTRHTVDIDGNWNSDEQPSAEQMTKDLQRAIDKAGYNLSVSLSRIRDVVDLYDLSQVIVLDKPEVVSALQASGRTLENFHTFLHRRTELEHAYERFRFAGDIAKSHFNEIYKTVKSFIRDMLPCEKHMER